MVWFRGKLRDDWRFRLLLAVLVAVALHIIAAGLFWKPQALTTLAVGKREPNFTIRLVHVTPMPSPTPVPTSAPLRIGRPEGRSAPPARVKTLAAPKIAPPRAIASPALSGSPVGSAGAGPARTGSPGNGTNGTGSGSSGSGNGSGGNVPCGYVSFQNIPPDHASPDGGIDVNILMTVTFPDGKAASTRLDYPFHYPDEASNPFSAINMHRSMTITLQRPPSDLINTEPALVTYVLSHTNAAGYTLLSPCPSAK